VKRTKGSGPRFGLLLVLLGGLAGLWLYSHSPASARRCADGFVTKGPRCCAPGQEFVAGHCRGEPTACPPGLQHRSAGCVATPERRRLEGGRLELGPNDWEAADLEPILVTLEAFEMDAVEVTEEQYESCVDARACTARNGVEPSEPGLPATRLSPEQAEAFCTWKQGRLPSQLEWLWAAAGSAARRYPWGQTGLVCRRAAYGLVEGPCAEGSRTPELAGSRPPGASPEGLLDLTGNVAEWVRAQRGYAAMGGSFRSRVAGQLKSWAAEPASRPRDDIGFRCAYAPGTP
jgi:formylglycine-generating enzyme required for sulfatase activity